MPAGVVDRFHQYKLDRVFSSYNELAEATERHQFESLKYEIERIRTHPNIQGYVITEFTDVNVNKIIGETLNLLEHQFKTSRIRVETDFHGDLPLIHGNAGKLQQVFLNLFVNAKDAMAGGSGTLRIATGNGTGVQVSVSDTGPGIAPEHINKIYDPFFTTKTSPREGQSRGTGLGLSVTYGIIQEHAGKIRVESLPGRGTTFHLEFPLIRKAVNV